MPGKRALGHDGDILSVAMDPDGDKIYSCAADKTIKVCNAHVAIVSSCRPLRRMNLSCVVVLRLPGSSDKLVMFEHDQFYVISRELDLV